jgi:ATP-dependent helicase YprA (DUF1998 family)
MKLSESVIEAYQDLILSEHSKLQKTDYNFEDPRSRLTLEEIGKLIEPKGLTFKDLASHGLLIEYPDSTYRTLHFDLMFRAVNLKTAVWSKKIPLEFRIPEPVPEIIPSFSEIPLSKIKEIKELPNEMVETLVNALNESGYDSLAFHQFYYLVKLREKKNKCYLIVSPTASGKSLIFYLSILIDILKELTKEQSTKGLILYPRKALASDQLLKFLKIIYALNKQLTKKGYRKITIAVDDGDTPRSASSVEIKNQEVFRGVKCVKKDCNGLLKYSLEENKTMVTCGECGQRYDEILPTKDDIWNNRPDIILSNLSALNRRMMMVSPQKTLTPDLKWVVLDEAHVYREELGGHAHWLLQRLITKLELLKGKTNFVISSATIPNPLEFASKLIGLECSDIYYEKFDKIAELSKDKRRKINLHLILAPNPLRSAESLTEELALLLGVWGLKNSKKAVVFVDNTAEVERLHNFVVNTIIMDRAEHNDHIIKYKQATEITNPFSWRPIAHTSSPIGKGELASIYGFHYADLPSEKRAVVEERFKSKKAGLLFSTSTLELGMDIGDIAAIVQYKVPIASESYVQRIGRAGRGRETYRVALGILVLTNSPSQLRYVLGDEYLWLIDPLKKDPHMEIPVASSNEEIMKQHIIYALLDVLASNGYTTYLDYKEEIVSSWSQVSDVLDSVKNLIDEANRNIRSIHDYVSRIGKSREAIKQAEELLKRLQDRVIENQQLLKKMGPRDVEDGLLKLHQAERQISKAIKDLARTRQNAQEISTKLSIKELEEYINKLREVEESLNLVLRDLEKIRGG